ncbi:MAG: 2-oxo-4-hydroxy-4-carboxy-5-ureidoimidazoline decarboxylase, partial [Phycisphaerae bacterium]|nr:2-oxo-4-hydroxy-4-carboxy-5-ureidoimidazoline decarboxylase [Phycisphaerae bacterium]
IRPGHVSWTDRAWLSGSHIDSVPTGGKFDGVAGVIAPLECLRAAAEDSLAVPLELIIFAEEEGTTFGIGMIGSRLWTGEIDPSLLAEFRNRDGMSYMEAGRDDGVDPNRLDLDRFQPHGYHGFIEIHIEQGPAMWKRNQSLAIVTAIAGRRQYRVQISGIPNHAGSTPMEYRADALVAASKVITGLQLLAIELSNSTVATVGRIECEPNAINVIPGIVRLTIDVRSPDANLLHIADGRIREMLTNCGAPFEITQTENQPPTPMDAQVCERLRRSADGAIAETASGALHDAAILAPLLPTAMIFVASRDGISHNPAEFSRVEDVAAAAALLLRTTTSPGTSKVTIRELNDFGRTAFDAICGPLFEHSPWIAQQTWPLRPFENVDALHAALFQTMNSASDDAKLALIRAHPDLVGKLARDGQLTADSTGEQASAGLTNLTTDEIRRFDELNSAYRKKFDFPFIICARENRKDAILAVMPRRLENNRQTEIATALAEIAKIARVRLLDRVCDS